MLPDTDIFSLCRSAFGAPSYEADEVAIFQGDCLELMRQLPPKMIDLAVTSPPYNIGKEYEDVLSQTQYLDWCESWIKQIHRITKSDGAFWLNLGYFGIPGKGRAIPIPYFLWNRTPFFLIQEIVWNYGAGVACRSMFSPRNEKFLWYVKDAMSYCFNLDEIRDPDVKYPNQKKNGKLKCNPLGKNPTDVWQFPKVTSGRDRSSEERTPHPAQFPLAVIERIIKCSSNEGDVILDPFLGSGTTAEAALRHGRKVIGFEIDPSYVQIASRRISNYFEAKQFAEAQIELALGV
ncbi:DNA-methyltransferase [Candidatus Thiodictyon syntrophicum]|jgi:adenine-specific DNA-methyltransferase|uniref:Methyltransferase n=1 Tax=Candidatus Thiodictyon syntrophicum TaxID=1166950 RepID=A0A2K8UG76_9GAMM|nr:site-specific DNA-methyltransferase [Candidatus Thiodictyon syntrophicum]AUB84558.1 site-specific DNA-methyltransferase [Candidatus Thiodictyon syntrophicum]